MKTAVIIQIKRFHVYSHPKFGRMMLVINITYQPDTVKVGQYGISGLRIKSGVLQKGGAIQAVRRFGINPAGTEPIQNPVLFDVGNIHNAYVLKV
jgi:hypothetical protein